MVSFDVTSVFANKPRDKTIEISLKRDFEKNEITTIPPRRGIKELLYLCLIMKYIHKMMA